MEAYQSKWPQGGGKMGVRIRAFNWQHTPLGHICTWPQSLRTVVELALASQHPAYVCWGPNLCSIYNDACADLLASKHPAGLGQPVYEVLPELQNSIKPLITKVLAGKSVYLTDQPFVIADEYQPIKNWFTGSVVPLRNEAGVVSGLFCNIIKTTDKILAEQSRRDSDERLEETASELARQSRFLQATLSSIPDFVYAFNRDRRFVYVNSTMQRLFGPDISLIGKTFADLNYPIDLADLLNTYIDTIFEKGKMVEDEVFYTSPIGISAYFDFVWGPVLAEDGSVELVVGVSRDNTERRRLQDRIRQSEERQAYLLKLSDALRPLQKVDEIKNTAARLLGSTLQVSRVHYGELSADELYCTIKSGYNQEVPVLEGVFRMADFGSKVAGLLKAGNNVVITDVQQTGWFSEPELAAFNGIGAVSNLVVPLIKEGRLKAVLALNHMEPREWTTTEIALVEATLQRTWDAVERAIAEKTLKKSEQRFKVVANLVPDLLWSNLPNGHTDWCNQRWMDYTGQSQEDATAYGWLDTIHPDDRTASMKTFQKAIGKGELLQMQHRIRSAAGEYRWFLVKAAPIYNDRGETVQWIGAATDIHEQKIAEQQLQHVNTLLEQQITERTQALQENRDLLHATLDSTLDMIQVFNAVRNEQGEIIDFTCILHNKTTEQLYGNVTGKSLLQQMPDAKQTGIFDSLKQVVETGHTQRYEKYYTHKNFSGWLYQSVVKLNDGVVTSTADITARKKAEEEQFKNFTLLRQSEEAALLGSWEYNLHTGAFFWSDGMYRLFNLPKGTRISPEIYLEYATAGSMEATQKLVNQIKTGEQDFEATIELSVNSTIKIVHIKATTIGNAVKERIRVLGLDLDITAVHTAQEKIKAMETEQRLEIFRATLGTQEEERRRISESLHNGLGQLLYGIKISLTYLNEQMAANSPDDFIAAKRYSNELLTQAITESRRISHELMPSVLEDFGLKTAIEDIGRQLRSSVTFTCSFKGLRNRLDKYLELAIFRTMQELMTNVVKHANATEAKADLTITTGNIIIRVQDNGQGIIPRKTAKPGIGLASIRSKVKLLNGTVKIDSAPDKGTAIEVRIPHTV
ncbi:PAS domain-containing protein [Mucilaginibacter sp. Bleaf8]|uniref:PAS domain-containing protein n=1 Tax=Mucilaginibacter sp. Bleaf8 TaxID=2834430 RepID=UPI001BCC5433|nr:PAS domain-containing protein [Mucilaginibacter sp. Bleaf8]MBS7565739.1 PAS domain-containing protein [Mucilaginibacter sp. Bleaf8]